MTDEGEESWQTGIPVGDVNGRLSARDGVGLCCRDRSSRSLSSSSDPRTRSLTGLPGSPHPVYTIDWVLIKLSQIYPQRTSLP